MCCRGLSWAAVCHRERPAANDSYCEQPTNKWSARLIIRAWARELSPTTRLRNNGLKTGGVGVGRKGGRGKKKCHICMSFKLFIFIKRSLSKGRSLEMFQELTIVYKID